MQYSTETTFPPYANYLHVLLPPTSVILWIGDLNYRISELDVSNVKELISKKDFETLHSYDQVILMCYSSCCSFKKSLLITCV